MRAKLENVFDPFYDGWEAYEQAGFGETGLAAVNEFEAPLMMLAVDQTDPDLADKVAAKYASMGLQAADLRVGLWPDAAPIPPREADEEVGVHLDIFGGRQAKYRNATEPERAILDAVTYEAEWLVIDAISPASDVAGYQFGKIPTLHKHIVGRERQPDGLSGLDVRERAFIDVERRREMRDRLASTATPERIDHIAGHVSSVLERFAR